MTSKKVSNNQGNDISSKATSGASIASNTVSPEIVVGVGASAGGLEALEAFFDGMPSDTGMAFVVVQHLSPDFKSMMDELLSRHTKMPIHGVVDGMSVEPSCIYLIPPKTEMIISDGKLLLTDKDPTGGLSLPIDIFFRSLANDLGSSSIAVVLSGTGTDGSRGVRAVNDAGGLVVVQTSDSAQFDGMPRAAEDTGCADLVIPPKEMGAALVRFAESGLEGSKNQGRIDDPMLRVFALLQERYQLDFASYKTNTVSRRIQRRLELLHDHNLPTYVARLEEDEQELESLYRDLLIGVTRFFRDEEAFGRLASKTIPEIFSYHEPTDEIRVWVAACATGEEAYSLAILLNEEAERREWQGPIKLFATDVHRTSIEIAGAGFYSAAQLQGVSAERLKRWFIKKEGAYQIVPSIRQSIVFAPHNLMRDAPFTKLDLVTCRNMLIYLRTEAQKKVLSLFHFSLRAGGIMWLGPSESPGELSDEFQALDSRWKIYRKRRDVSLLADIRMSTPTLSTELRASSGGRTPVLVPKLTERQVISAYEQLSSDYIPPSLVVNSHIELIYATTGASEYLKRTEGFMQSGLLELVISPLRSTLAGLMQRAAREKQTITYEGIVLDHLEENKTIDITVKPAVLPRMDDEFYLISFIEHALQVDSVKPQKTDWNSTRLNSNDVAEEHLDTLERELQATKQNLQATIQELETSNEELQASNEELVASNEELQSTNEELHSVNEELHTVNTEHQRQIDLLTELTEDMENLLTATDAATLFLDDQVCIRRISPGAQHVFNVLESDLGRRLDNFNHTLDYPDFVADVEQVLSIRQRLEKEVMDVKKTPYLIRMTPYQSRIGTAGVVVSLVDTSVSQAARLELIKREHRFRGTFENAAVGIGHVNLDGTWLDVNQRLCDIVGYEKSELLASTFQDITHRDDLDADIKLLKQLIKGDRDRYSLEKRYFRKDGGEVWINLTVSLQRDDAGDPMYCISIMQDISKRKQFEKELTKAVKQRDRFLATLSHELRNPLAALVHAARLMDRKRRGEKGDKPLDVILRQSVQMGRLLDDLLDVSRVTQDKIILTREPCDLRQITREACEAILPQVEAKLHTLVIDVPEDAVWVDADRTRILQVVENLLTNATKYTPDKGQIRLSITTDAVYSKVEVVDSGCGLSSEMLDKVFDMFVQSEINRQDREGGMGIGLTLVKSLVEMHDGMVEAKSEGSGKGSTFTVLIPLTDKRPSDLKIENKSTEARQKRRKVVLVEDEKDAREMLTETLRLDGYKVTAAADGDQGLAAILRERPDVALVDVALPGMTGLQIATQVRKTFGAEQIYLVALTGFGRDSDRKEALAAGFDEHLVKPVRSEELTRVLTMPINTASPND